MESISHDKHLEKLKLHFEVALGELGGLKLACIPIDVLSLDPESGIALLRVPFRYKHYSKRMCRVP